MRRLGLTVFVVTLVGGTTAAFVLAEILKLEPSPLTRPRFDRVVSPACGCPRETARLSIRLKKADTIDAVIVDADDDPVRILATRIPRTAGRIRLRWDGTDDGGDIVPDGRYRLRIELARAERTIVVPEVVRVDTRPSESSEAAIVSGASP